jgi:predicted TIM-barrel fold metal-dependent hydrolase
METFLKRYGSRKLLFGSDFPFGIPSSELAKVRHLGLKEPDYENVVCANVLRLILQQEA